LKYASYLIVEGTNKEKHYDRGRPQVADWTDFLQIWKVSANMLKKQSETQTGGLLASLGFWRGANDPSQWKKGSYKKKL